MLFCHKTNTNNQINQTFICYAQIENSVIETVKGAPTYMHVSYNSMTNRIFLIKSD